MDYEVTMPRRVVVLMASLTRSVRRRIDARFDQLERFPHNMSQSVTHDVSGRLLEVTVCAGYEIYYWIDYAERAVKIVAMRKVDRRW
jgi:hypothetical protein